jgi:hypothetical protein
MLVRAGASVCKTRPDGVTAIWLAAQVLFIYHSVGSSCLDDNHNGNGNRVSVRSYIMYQDTS